MCTPVPKVGTVPAKIYAFYVLCSRIVKLPFSHISITFDEKERERDTHRERERGRERRGEMETCKRTGRVEERIYFV